MAAHDRYEKLYNLAPVGYMTASISGTVVDVNQTLAKLLVANPADLIGLAVPKLVYPADQDTILTHLHSLKEATDAMSCEVRMCPLDESPPVWVRVNSVQEPRYGEDTVLVTITDIGETKEVHERLGLATRAANCGIWDWDIINDKLIWDDVMYELYGISEKDLIGGVRTWEQTLHPLDYQRVVGEIQLALDNVRDYDTDFSVVWPDGTIHHLRALAMVVRDAQGRAVRMLGTNWDITESKQMETTLQGAKDAAEAASRAKSSFLANMSHEIRTPLNAIIGMSDLLLAALQEPEQRDYLETIRASSDQLLALINDVLDLSKIEAGSLTCERLPFSLRRCIEDTERMIRNQAEEKGLTLSVTLDVPHDRLTGDVIRIQQILLNLLDNAVKFTHKGGVRLEVTAQSISTNVLDLVFRVEDSGIGISKSRLPTLFDRFHQGDSSTTREYGGTGLGLSICSRLAELMGGRIDVRSESGAGSVFTFILPKVQIAPMADAKAIEDPRPGLSGSQHSKKMAKEFAATVLVAEDDAISQKVIGRMLLALGYQATIVSDGLQAIQAVTTQEFDVVFMDVQMPRCDGLEASLRIREKLGSQGPKIIALTAGAGEDDHRLCREAGMDVFLSKPVRQEDLAAALRQCLAPVDSRAEN